MYEDDIYKDLKDTLADFISQKTDDEVKTDLKISVDTYFDEEISKYSREELIRYLDSPEKIIKHFKDYLDGKDCLLC